MKLTYLLNVDAFATGIWASNDVGTVPHLAQASRVVDERGDVDLLQRVSTRLDNYTNKQYCLMVSVQ